MSKRKLQLKAAYIATLRCRTWCQWPESKTYQSVGYKDRILTTTDNPVYVSVGIATYAAQNSEETGPPKPLEGNAGPSIVTEDSSCGYWIGDAMVVEPGKQHHIVPIPRPPHEGEIDVNLYISALHPKALEELPRGRLEETAGLICTTATVFLNLFLGELAVPVQPVQLRKIVRKGATDFGRTVRTRVQPRNPVTPERAQAATDIFTSARSTMPAKEARALSVAASRYLASLSATDPIDRYCDLWESFEFSGFGSKGGTRKSSARILSKHLSTTSRTFNASQIEAALELDDLYDTRCQIVRRAVEHPDDLESKRALLEEIARELLNHHSSYPIAGGTIPE